MKKSYLLIFALLSSFTIGIAQSDADMEKKMEKAHKLIDKDKLDDADKYLNKLLEKNPNYGPGWDLLADIRYHQYQESKQMKMMFTVSASGKDGKKDTVKDDSLTKSLQDLLSKIDLSKPSYNSLLATIRKATMSCNNAYSCSSYMRILVVDPKLDTNISDKAKDYFDKAETQFSDKNYEQAAILYKKAVTEQPNYYKASMYLGDAYYFQEKYPEATEIWKADILKFPNLLEPRKYLVDAYAKQLKWKDALDESIKAVTVYPDYSLEEKIQNAAYFSEKGLKIKWTPREVFPNRMANDTADNYSTETTEYASKPTGPWKYYVDAMNKIQGNCNSKGIITTPSSLTKSLYLEVYSWEEMLANSTDPSLDEARRMQKEGYLDCYVLVTCFHQDFYDQYLDFVAKNKDKVMAYYKRFIY